MRCSSLPLSVGRASLVQISASIRSSSLSRQMVDGATQLRHRLGIRLRRPGLRLQRRGGALDDGAVVVGWRSGRLRQQQ